MFNSIINDLADGMKYTFSEFADNAKLGGVADRPEATIHRDLDRLGK